MLTNAKSIPPYISKILAGIEGIGMPVMLTKMSSFEAADVVNTMRRALHPLASEHGGVQQGKLETAQMLIDKHIDPAFVDAMVAPSSTVRDMSPLIFKHNMFSAARKNKQKIVLPEVASKPS